MTLYLPEPGQIVVGVVLTLAVAGAARWFEAVSASGFLAGIAVGVAVSVGLGSPGILPLGLFFVLGSAATRWRYAEKHRRGVAEPGGGRRGAGRVLAKGSVGAALAIAGLFTLFQDSLVRAAFVGAFAAAAADTLGTEIGQIVGKRPFTLLPPRRVPPGTPGAVSGGGLLWGFAGAAAVALGGWFAGLLSPAGIACVAVAGLLGSVVEAAAAPLLRKVPLRDLAANLVTTASGAAIAGGLLALSVRAGIGR